MENFRMKNSEALIDFPHIIRKVMDQAFRSKLGGNSKTLDEFFVQEGLKEGFDGNYTTEIITNHLLLHLAEQEEPKFPSLNDHIKTLPYEYWSNWDEGVTKVLKNEVNVEIKEKKWNNIKTAISKGVKSITDFQDNFVFERAKEYQEQNNGSLPNRNSGTLNGYPYLTWAMLEDALCKAKCRS